MKRKKICFIISTPLTVKAFLVNHIIALNQNYDIYLIANLDAYDSSFLEKLPIKHIKDIKIVRSISPFYDSLAIVKLYDYLKKEKFDAVHSVTPKAGLLGMVASNSAKIKNRFHIFTGQVWATKKGIMKILLKFIDKIIVKNSTQILVDGEPQRKFLINEGIVLEKKSIVLGKGSISGVDTNQFFLSVMESQIVRKELAIHDSEVIFMFLGRLKEDKGIKELASAFNLLSNKYKDVTLLIVGEDEEQLKNYILDSVSNKSKVIVYGATTEPRRLLQVADVFCMPSHREGFGTSVLEASLMGKPIVCSDIYGLADTIIDNVTGIRHKVKDSQSLFLSMEKLYLNELDRKKMGKNARNYVLNNFESDMISNEWLRFYDNIL